MENCAAVVSEWPIWTRLNRPFKIMNSEKGSIFSCYMSATEVQDTAIANQSNHIINNNSASSGDAINWEFNNMASG